MKPSEIRQLVHLGAPDAPYGVKALARCYEIDDLARLARKRLPAGVAGYLDGGGEDEWTLRRNRAAFGEVELIPRVLREVSHVDTATTVLGTPVPLPVVLSPVGGPRMFHYQGELAVARAAREAGLPYAVSTLATQSLADIAGAAEGSPLWLQLYVWGDRSVARDLIARAKAAGYRALLLSADTTVRSERHRELRRGIELPTPELTARTVLDGARHPRWSWHFLTSPAIGFPNLAQSGPTSRERMKEMFDGTVSWRDLDWIRQEWDGPIAVKGILRVEEAVRAADSGVDAVVVSNHGGRQLDHVPATLEVLPGIADAVGDRVELLFDSGIRRGADIVAALSLGARAVLAGRLICTDWRRRANPACGTRSTSSPKNCAWRWGYAERPPWPTSVRTCSGSADRRPYSLLLRKGTTMPKTDKNGEPRESELPGTLRRSPEKAQETFAKTYDSALAQYGDEERAHRVAYSALKHSFQKVGDHWEQKKRRGPSDPRAADPRARENHGRTFGGVDYYGSSKEELMRRAAELGVRGRSRMTKAELADAIARKQD